jgi:hypothetical protein
VQRFAEQPARDPAAAPSFGHHQGREMGLYLAVRLRLDQCDDLALIDSHEGG